MNGIEESLKRPQNILRVALSEEESDAVADEIFVNIGYWRD